MIGDTLANNGSKAALFAKVAWSTQADQWFDDLEVGYRFSSEDLVNAIGLPDVRYTNSNNAVGAKIRTWSHQRKIERVGFVKSQRSESHSRMIFLWEKNNA